ncbi:MAG: hypothetical protein JO327_02055 [Nitrososphaeraceae archaeon]|nr:hypothetical protein [Nitrososphaeraceae archaeon]
MADTNNREAGRRSEHNHQQQYTQEYKKLYSVKKGAGYGAFGGFIAAVSFTGIMLWMPTIFHFPEGTFLHTLSSSTVGTKSDPVLSGLAAFSIILIQGIVVGVIFGVVTSKVKALHPSSKYRGIGFGLATGIIAFLVLYLPVIFTGYPQLLIRTFATFPTAELSTRGVQDHNIMILSSYPKYLPGIIGLGVLAYLVYGFLMGGIITLAYSVYNFDLMKMKEKERQEKEEGKKKAKDEKTRNDTRQQK